jgi:hypothetical protein
MMLDLVPFAGGRRIMHNRDRKLFVIGQILQLLLSQAISHAIGTAPISCDQQRLLARIECFTPLLPPPSDAFHCELRSLVINPKHSQSLDCQGDRR